MTAQIPIFDTDTHYTEPRDLWTSRAPQKYKGKVLHVRENSAGSDSWVVEGVELGLIGANVIDKEMNKQYGIITMPKFESATRAGTYARERLAYMDSAGVGTQIVYPNVIGFGGQVLMTATKDAELRLWHMRAYNDAILELQKDSGGRICPQAALPLWDLDASIAELHRVRKLGITGIAMSNTPGHFGQPPLADPKWDRFFSACQDMEMPLNFHLASGDWIGNTERWWGQDRVAIHPDGVINAPLIMFMTSVNFTGNMIDVVNLIMSGVLEKFPRLKFVSVESNCGWAPSIIQGLEHNWGEMMRGEQLTRFKRRPKEMFMDQIYCTYWLEKRNCIDSFIEEFGPGNLMFETDFPHPVSLYPNNLVTAKIKETLGHHSRETQEKILHKNAENVYGIKVHQPSAQKH